MMRSFKAKNYNRSEVILEASQSITDLVNAITKEEDFEMVTADRVYYVIGSPLATRLRNGEFMISKETKGVEQK